VVVTPARDRDVDQAILRGSELLKAGKLDEAQRVFRAALALDAGNARVLALLGLALFRGGNFSQAQPIYEQLVERAPTDPSHRLNLGLVYLKLGDADHAIAALEASRALDPSQGRAVSYLGLAYARSGRFAEAYRAFLLAGQHDLASEIESNLTATERADIHGQMQRAGLEPAPATDDVDTQRVKPSALEASADGAGAKARPAELVAEPSGRANTSGEKHAEPHPGPPPPPPAKPAVLAALEAETSAPSRELTGPRMTESLQFVLPTSAAIPKPADGQSMISVAVAAASPAGGATAVSTGRVAAGSQPPQPLSQLATDDLVRPEDGDQPFEVTGSGALVIRVLHRVLTRLDRVHVSGGDLSYEPATRRSRGHQTDERFDYGGAQMHAVTGRGYLVALPGKDVFTAVTLDDDIFYLREDLVFSFQDSLRWENGNVPGLRGRFPVVQFRGDGGVALRSPEPLVRIKLPSQGLQFVDARRLAGWIGRVIPRAVVSPVGGPMGEVCVECTGEGIVLVDPAGDPAMFAPREFASMPRVRVTNPPPPPTPSSDQPHELNLTKTEDELRDEF
jgi:hypothetical protein